MLVVWMAWADWDAYESEWSLEHAFVSEDVPVTACKLLVNLDDKNSSPFSSRGRCQRCESILARMDREEEQAAKREQRAAEAALAVAEPEQPETTPEPTEQPETCASCGARLEFDALGNCYHCGAVQ